MRSLKNPFILVFALFALFACGDDSSSDAPEKPPIKIATPQESARAIELVAEAVAKEAEFDYAGAQQLYQEAFQNDPAHPRAQRRRKLAEVTVADAQKAEVERKAGVNFMVANRTFRAYDRLAKARKLDPNSRKVRRDLASVSLAVQRYHTATIFFEEMIAEDPDDAWAILGLAETAFHRGDTLKCIATLSDERIAMIRKKSESDPKLKKSYPESLFLLGVAAQTERRPVVAKKALEEALAIRPDSVKFIHQYGGALLEDGKFEAAITQFKRVLEFSPDFDDDYVNLATAYSRKGDFEEALVWYAKATAARPRDWETRIKYGRALESMGSKESYRRAVTILDEALTLNPSAHEAYETLGRIYRRLGKKVLAKRYGTIFKNFRNFITKQEEELRVNQRRVAKNPKDTEARLSSIRLHQEFAHIEEVMRQSRELLIAEPEHPEGFYYLALSYEVKRQYHNALCAALAMVDVAPKDSRGYHLAARGYARRDEWETSLDYARKGFDLNPGDFGSVEAFAQALQKLGHQKELDRIAPLYIRLREQEQRMMKEREEQQKEEYEALRNN